MAVFRYVPLLALAGCLGLAPASAGAEDTGEALPLPVAIEAALARNFTIRVSRVDSALAAQAVRRAAGSFDPTLEASYGYNRTDYPELAGRSETGTASVGVNGELPTGTRYSIGVLANDATDPFSTIDEDGQFVSGDRVTTSASISVTQPLLRGFLSNDSATRIRIARRQRDQSDEALRGAVIDTVTETIRAYYTLFFAERSLSIAEQNRANAAQLLEDNRRRVEAGAIAPLDIYQAQSEVAVRESAVISARRQRRAAANDLKALIFDDPLAILDRSVRAADLPTLAPVLPDPRADYPRALDARPDYQQILAERDVRELEVERDRWSARPQLDLFATVGRRSLDQSLSSTFDQLGEEGNDRVAVGAIFSYPLFNRTRDADRVSSMLRRNRTELLDRRLQQQVMVELDNAAAAVTAAWERVVATGEGLKLAEKSLEAEEKKLQVGNSTTFVVLRLQSDLANAEIRQVIAQIDYFTALADYERARGTTLETLGIELP